MNTAGPALFYLINGAKLAHGESMAGYLTFMSVRLIELHRILKPTGSIYLHCDDAAVHYLKAVYGLPCSGRKTSSTTWSGNGPHPTTTPGGSGASLTIFYFIPEGQPANGTPKPLVHPKAMRNWLQPIHRKMSADATVQQI